MPFDEAHHDHGGGGNDPHDPIRLENFVLAMMQTGMELGRQVCVCPTCSASLLLVALARNLAAHETEEYKATVLAALTKELENKNVH